MKLQASRVRLWFVVLTFTGANLAAAQTSSSLASSTSRGIEGTRELSTAVSINSSAVSGSTADSLPDAPSTVAAAQSSQNAPVAANEGMQSSPKPPANGSLGLPFIAANAMLLGSTIADAEIIARCRPTACQSVPDAIRSRGALYGIGIPASLGISYISYRIKRGGSRWWIAPVAIFTAGNVVYAVHASQWAR